MAKKYLLLIPILLFAGFLLFFKLNQIPTGLNNDQVSEGYNAYSILKTGADRYGMVYPILFRSLGTYLLPLYTYLTVVAFSTFGATAMSVSLVSILSGLYIVLITFLLFKSEDKAKSFPFSIAVAFVLSFVPWLIFFSRSSTEVTLSLAIFLTGVYFLMQSLKKPTNFIIACLFFGLSTWAYYSERLIVPIFLPLFVTILGRSLFRSKKILLVGVAVLAITQVPNLFLLKTGAITRRLSQVSYLSYGDFVKSSGNLKNEPFGQLIYVSREFVSHYIAYFSPRSLFFQPDDQTLRSMPGLSVFYNWTLIPFVMGIAVLIKSKKTNLQKVMLMLSFTSLIPAALTVEPFYTIRVLVFLWTVTVVVTYGIVKFPRLLLIPLFIYSLFCLYNSYFVLFKYEREIDYGHQYFQLMDIIKSNPDKKFIIDNSRDPSICIRLAFFNLYPPQKFQDTVGKEFLTNYYSDYRVGEDCSIGNAEVKQIDWGTDIGDNMVVVGDLYAISSEQARIHGLKLKFEIKDSEQNPVLIGYSNEK